MKPQLTNEDKTRQLERKASKALLAGIARDWEAAEAAATEAGKQTIVGINRLRACGDKIKQLCGHEQLTADFYMRVQADLPPSMRYTGARAAVHIANRLEKDVETIQEAMLVQRELFAALLEFKEPKRIEAQESHERNPWNDFVAGTANLVALFDKLHDAGMEDWPPDKLKKFADTTDPVALKNFKAHELLGDRK